MTTTGDPRPPEGSWTHSFEEDADGLEIYRPTLDYPFPPARRPRSRLIFGDGTVVEAEPGPDDRPRPGGALSAAGPRRFAGPGSGGIEIVDSSPEIIRIRRF